MTSTRTTIAAIIPLLILLACGPDDASMSGFDGDSGTSETGDPIAEPEYSVDGIGEKCPCADGLPCVDGVCGPCVDDQLGCTCQDGDVCDLELTDNVCDSIETA